MAIHTPREKVQLLLAAARNKKKDKKSGRRNYMKKQMQGIPADDPAYLELLRNAGDKKAPYAEKTKGYYRFSREFPGTVDAQGYRVNGKQKEKPPAQKTLVAVAVFAVVLFCIAYTMTDTMLGISQAEPLPTTTAPVEEATTHETENTTLTDPTSVSDPTQEGASDVQPTEQVTEEDLTVPSDPAATEESSVLVSAEPTEVIPENSSIFNQAPTEDGRQPDLQDGWN